MEIWSLSMSNQFLNNGEAEWVTMDLFDTDDLDRVIEHRDIIAPFKDNPANPFGAVDGTREVTDQDKTDQNIAWVRRFTNEDLVGRDCWHGILLHWQEPEWHRLTPGWLYLRAPDWGYVFGS